MSFNPGRLLYQLNNTGLQIKDNRLYQLLKDLLTGLEDLSSTTNTIIASGTTPSTIINSIIQLSDSSSDSDSSDSLTIPGPAGIDGSNGMVPYFIASGEVFIIPEFKQALFSINIDNEGILEIDGFLIEV